MTFQFLSVTLPPKHLNYRVLKNLGRPRSLSVTILQYSMKRRPAQPSLLRIHIIYHCVLLSLYNALLSLCGVLFSQCARMNTLIKSNDHHNVLLRNAYLDDKHLCIENKKMLASLQRLLNVNFDTECKMLGSYLDLKKSLKINFLLNYNFSKIMFSVVSSHFTVHYLTMILRSF